MLEGHKHKKPTHDFDGITENRVTSPPAYFNILFYGLIIWGVIFCAYYLFSGWSSHQEFEEKMAAHNNAYASAAPTAAPAAAAEAVPAAATDSSGGPVDAAALYASKCAGCHGANAEGGYGPDLTGDYEFGKSPDDVRESIAEGREGKMPGFAGRLSSEEIDALVDYLLKL